MRYPAWAGTEAPWRRRANSCARAGPEVGAASPEALRRALSDLASMVFRIGVADIVALEMPDSLGLEVADEGEVVAIMRCAYQLVGWWDQPGLVTTE